ncbi:sensor histidine kinase [Lichenicola sp.]|uniref:sensor histidine kinase n=1 Tax=Lichenicola sp. TaxID=2804529 RepID=UPI003B003C1F
MHSLRSRLWVLWALALAASIGVGLLLIQLYRTSTTAQVERSEAVLAGACDSIRDRYRFYMAGSGATPAPAAALADPGLRAGLTQVVVAGLIGQAGVEGGIWSATTGSLAYAFPTYEGTGPKSDLPVAELPTIRSANQQAGRSERAVLQRVASGTQTLLVAACPISGPPSGPIDGLTGWTMTRVRQAQGYDRLRAGLGLLLALVLGIAGWGTWLTAAWGRHVGRIETALAAHSIEDLPTLPRTGERELDRIIAALNDAGGRLAAARTRSTEMASRVAAAERLAALGRVAAGVAHEIRNPMAAMRLRAENALTGDAARQRPALEASLEQISRVDRLVDELLAMTLRRRPERQTLELTDFLQARAADHRERATAAGILLSVEGAAGRAAFDPELIGRALDNLLLNAIRHTPAGGRVRMQADGDADTVRVAVSDSGPGIDPALRSRLFEPFVTGRPDGTGLGLAIAREMAEAHAGSLVLTEPGGDGVGATFLLELSRMPPCPPS